MPVSQYVTGPLSHAGTNYRINPTTAVTKTKWQGERMTLSRIANRGRSKITLQSENIGSACLISASMCANSLASFNITAAFSLHFSVLFSLHFCISLECLMLDFSGLLEISVFWQHSCSTSYKKCVLYAFSKQCQNLTVIIQFFRTKGVGCSTYGSLVMNSQKMQDPF